MPPNAEILLHAAVVYASLGRTREAAEALKQSADLDASMKERPEFKEAQRKISGGDVPPRMTRGAASES